MNILKRDIEKMLDYYSKGSRPEVLACTVKDLNKAMSRAVIANAMGWKGCSREFINRCKELGATNADIAEVERMCDTYELPDEYKSQFDNGPKLEDVSRLRDWFPKLFKVLRDHKVQNIKLKTRKPTRDELEKDNRDGRCWTLAYTVSFDHNGNHYDWDIANHTNEGGGSFGVSAKSPLSVYIGTQQFLADRAANILDRNISESKISIITNKVLSGMSVRQAVLEGTDTEPQTLKQIIAEIVATKKVFTVAAQKKYGDIINDKTNVGDAFQLNTKDGNYIYKKIADDLWHDSNIDEDYDSADLAKMIFGMCILGKWKFLHETKSLIKEDDQEYWDYVHTYGDAKEREEAADYFDVTPSAFDETYSQFFEIDESVG